MSDPCHGPRGERATDKAAAYTGKDGDEGGVGDGLVAA